MTPAISTTFSSCSWSRTQSMAIRVPVLPTPALHDFGSNYYWNTDTDIPAMKNHWPFCRHVVFHDFPVEGQERSGIVRHSMIRPGCEVELSHNESMFRATTQLWEINRFNVSYDYTELFTCTENSRVV